MRGVVLLVVLASCRFGFEDHPIAGDGAVADAEGLRIAEVALGVDMTCALSNTALVKCWGNNLWGKLGIESPDTSARGDEPGELAQLPSLKLGTGRTVTHLVRAADYTCAQLDDQTIKCWGNNDGGQLGNGEYGNIGDAPGEMGDGLSIVKVGGGGPFATAAAGHYHTCVLRSGTVWCYGQNDFGQDGLGDPDAHVTDVATLAPVDLGAFSPVALTAQFNSTCAVDAQGRVKCWGENDNGSLGYGDALSRGYAAGQMGAALGFVPLGIGVSVEQLTAGYAHICAITNAGAVCWGTNEHGELALSTGNAGPIGDSPNEVANLVPIDVGGAITQITGGQASTCALLATGEVSCWGGNDSGQLCLGDTANRGDDPGEISAALRVPLPERALSIASGHSHSCAILASGAIACWGANDFGQLGAGDTNNRGDEPGELPFVIRATDLW